MFCGAACDSSCDEQPHLLEVVPGTTDQRKKQESTQATGALNATSQLLLWTEIIDEKRGVILTNGQRQIYIWFTCPNAIQIIQSQSLFVAVDPIFSSQASSIMKYLPNLHPHSLTRFCLFALSASVCVWPRSWTRWGLKPPSTQCLRRHTDSLTLLWTYMGAAEATAGVRGRRSCTSQTMRCFCPQQRQTAQATHMKQRVFWKTSFDLSSSDVFHRQLFIT